jgi:hypothetical protein
MGEDLYRNVLSFCLIHLSGKCDNSIDMYNVIEQE